MDKSKKVILGGLAGIGIAGAIYYLSDDGKGSDVAPTQSLTREEVIAILKDFRKETMQAFVTLASFALSLKEQIGGRITNEQIKEILTMQSPILAQLRRMEAKILEQHSISQATFQHAVEVTFKDDPEVKALTSEMKTQLENAFIGEAPSMNQGCPDFMTPELTITVLQEMYYISKCITFLKIDELKEQGVQINPYNQQFVAAAQEMEAETETAKFKMFEKYGLTNQEQPASFILHSAIQKHSASNPMFKTRLAQIEEEFKYSMQAIMQDSLPLQEQARLRQYNQPLIQEITADDPTPDVEIEPVEQVTLN